MVCQTDLRKWWLKVLDIMDECREYYQAVRAYNRSESKISPPDIDGWTIDEIRNWLQGKPVIEQSQGANGKNGRSSLVPEGNQPLVPKGDEPLVPNGNTKNNSSTEEEPPKEEPEGFFSPKETGEKKGLTPLPDLVFSSEDELLETMTGENIGMHRTGAKRLLDIYGFEQCARQLMHLSNRIKNYELRGEQVDNPAGLLRSSIKGDWGPPRDPARHQGERGAVAEQRE
jgi:hypothetical protein